MSELNVLSENAIEPHEAPWPVDTARTGDQAVDSALEQLSGIRSVPLSEHNGAYAEIHDSLMAALDAGER